jgi:hypothetical protein
MITDSLFFTIIGVISGLISLTFIIFIGHLIFHDFLLTKTIKLSQSNRRKIIEIIT